MKATENLNAVLRQAVEDKNHPLHVEITQENVRDIMMTLMVDIPISILGPEANMIHILSEAMQEYHFRMVNDSLEYGAHNPEAIIAAIKAREEQTKEPEPTMSPEEEQKEFEEIFGKNE